MLVACVLQVTYRYCYDDTNKTEAGPDTRPGWIVRRDSPRRIYKPRGLYAFPTELVA